MKQKLIALASFLFLTFHTIPEGIGQWKKTGPIPGNDIYSFAESGGKIFAATDSGVFLSSDNGDHWRSCLSGAYPTVLMKDRMQLFAGTAGAGIFLSIDDGRSWVQTNPVTEQNLILSLVKMGTILFAGSGTAPGGIVLRSDDNGISWVMANKGFSTKAGNIFSLATIGTSIIAGTNEGIYTSEDSGAHWVAAGLENYAVYNIIVNGTNLFAGAVNDLGGGGAFISSDNGKNWEVTSFQSSGVNSLFAKGSNLFVSHYGIVFLSTDNGINWKNFPGLPDTYTEQLIGVGEYLYAGSQYNGVWRRSFSDFGINDVKSKTPLTVSLSPNPTTGMITVHNAPSDLKEVVITNILGERILQLLDPETMEFTVDLSKFPDGTYVARFSTPSEVIVCKILKE